jgi:DNA-binding NarL/FixJ family response regulator
MLTTPRVGGPSPVPAVRPAPEALTAREEQVLNLIAWGYANTEIAARLRLTVKTVETYTARGMEKLELRGRAGVVRFAVRAGWLVEGGAFDPAPQSEPDAYRGPPADGRPL